MGESAAHANLVKILAAWVANSLLNGDYGHILMDAPDRPPEQKPPIVYDFIPDIFVVNAPGYGFIIGEAKTTRDIENRHTMEQVKAFLLKCAESEASFFVLAVPWHSVRLAASIINYCKRMIGAEGVRTKVLEKLPG